VTPPSDPKALLLAIGELVARGETALAEAEGGLSLAVARVERARENLHRLCDLFEMLAPVVARKVDHAEDATF
jgi:hypothetical protein